MTFFYTDSPNRSKLKYCIDKNYFVLDHNINNFFYLKNKFNLVSYKNLYKNLNFVPYKKYYRDFKANTLFCALLYVNGKEIDNSLDFIFDVSNKNIFFLDCVNSLVKRKKIFHTITPNQNTEKFCLKVKQIKEILNLTNFLLKTKVIFDCENFFDFVYNYYFYLSEDFKQVE